MTKTAMYETYSASHVQKQMYVLDVMISASSNVTINYLWYEMRLTLLAELNVIEISYISCFTTK